MQGLVGRLAREVEEGRGKVDAERELLRGAARRDAARIAEFPTDWVR